MPPRIGPIHPIRLFLREWRESRGLTQQQLADRLDVGKDQISRWENQKRGLSTEVQAALCEGLAINPVDLYRHPETPSADALLEKATPEQRQMAIDLLKTLLKAG